MTVNFCDYFWGEKNNGFDVLYHNMKYGQIASKDLVDFFRERLSVEETQSKLFGKLAKQVGNVSSNGTFAPLWQVMKQSLEKLSTLHQQMLQQFQELVKEVAKYCEDQHKHHKTIKDEESATLEAVQSIQSTTATLMKAKENYNQKSIEFEKLKKDGASAKDVEKAETKLKKACEEYKVLVEKYGVVRDEFERRMTQACRHFQTVEESHLQQMKVFLANYVNNLENGHNLIGQVHIEFKQQCAEMTVDKLLCKFTESKSTGKDRPAIVPRQEGPVQFEEAEVLSVTPPLSVASSASPSLSSAPSSSSGAATAVVVGGGAVCNVPGGGEVATVAASSAGTGTTAATTGTGTESAVGDHSSSVNKEGNKNAQPINNTPGIKSKPSRRTTSLLNLFLPSHGLLNRPTSPSPPSNPSAVRDGSLSTNGSAADPALSRNTIRGSKWLWKSKRDKKKEKKGRKKKGDQKKEDNMTVEEEDNESVTVPLEIPEVDEEGYSIRPAIVTKYTTERRSISSSDSDSEDEKECKIHVEIKPLTNGTAPLSASIDELRASVGGITLASMGQGTSRKSPSTELEASMKRSISMSSQQLGYGSAMNGKARMQRGLQSPATSSSASTPTGGYGFATPIAAATGATSPVSSDVKSAETTPTQSEESGDVFSELGDLPPALPPKFSHQASGRVSTPIGPPLLPRPPSRRAVDSASGRGRASPVSHLNRADSLGSLSSEFRTSSMSVGSSRGPSPLTIGMSDIIPIAVAFQEIVHAYFRGTEESRCQVKLTGDMMLSFPAGIIQILTNNPSPAVLTFKIKNLAKMESIVPNKQLLTRNESASSTEAAVYEFSMPALSSLLRRQAEQNPLASYFNVDILKYQVKSGPGAQSTPLQLVSYWKCEPQFTDLHVDYKYNGQALMSPLPLLNITLHVPVDGCVTAMQSQPKGEWVPQSNRAVWRLTELSQHSDNGGTGSVRARLDVSSGPSSPGTITATFSIEGTTLSGADFELVGLGYRVSLIKRRVIAGKYICESDVDMRYRYAAPPV